MRIIKLKKIIIFLLIIGAMVIITGCARWTDEEPEPGEADYQLEITVEVSGIIDSYNGIYYIVMDADGNAATGPEYDVSSWDDRFYYVKLEDEFFDIAQVKDDFELNFNGGSVSGNKIQATIALSDLEDPNSIDINVITTDSENNTYDHLDSYFPISNAFGATVTREDTVDDSGDGGTDFDIIKVTAVITTLY